MAPAKLEGWMQTPRMVEKRKAAATRKARALDALKTIALVALLLTCFLAASYGDTITGINPQPQATAAAS